MEKERNSKLIAIIALVVAVCGLSFGFAAFTKDLNIQFSESNVNVSGDLDVRIHAYDSNSMIDVNKMTIEPIMMSETGIEAESFTISDDYSIINGGSVIFSNFDKVALYTFALKNYSEYDAYLNDISMLNGGTDLSDFKTCIAESGTSQSMVDEACDNIHLAIVSEDKSLVLATAGYVYNNLVIPAGEEVVLGIVFLYDGPNSLGEMFEDLEENPTTPLPDGDFKIDFAGLKFNFSSVAANND